MLIGEYEHSLDVKGRLIMPAKLRQDIGEKFIITKGLDGCLFVFSENKLYNSHAIYISTSVNLNRRGK